MPSKAVPPPAPPADAARRARKRYTVGLPRARVERATPAVGAGLAGLPPHTRQPIYLLSGPFAEFHGLLRKHHLAMERALSEDDAPPLQTTEPYDLGDTE